MTVIITHRYELSVYLFLVYLIKLNQCVITIMILVIGCYNLQRFIYHIVPGKFLVICILLISHTHHRTPFMTYDVSHFHEILGNGSILQLKGLYNMILIKFRISNGIHPDSYYLQMAIHYPEWKECNYLSDKVP